MYAYDPLKSGLEFQSERKRVAGAVAEDAVPVSLPRRLKASLDTSAFLPSSAARQEGSRVTVRRRERSSVFTSPGEAFSTALAEGPVSQEQTWSPSAANEKMSFTH